ncbi:MAG: alpha/beta fold hydrolase [Candidatus Symbiobacter sp.]|nr:alpha/beta fold hydrolase [Candidatus Symbiobacter sp.]
MPVFWPVPVPPPADAATDAAPDPTQSRPDATTAAAAPCLRNYAQTRQFGRCQGKKPILVIPSLINRANILDLSEDNSFMRHLAAKLADRDYAPFLLDWGEPGATERHYDLADYVRIPLAQALASLDDISRPRARATPQPVTVMGYCMGGVLALALALRHPDRVRNLVLLATPWDVHADAALQHRMQPIFPWLHYWLAPWLRPGAALPVDVLQSLFFAVDPMLSLKKFTALAQTYEAQTGQAQSGQSQTYLSQEENLEKRRQFARVEDWVNNGMVLAGPVAQECLFGWYRDNDLAGLRWKIDGQTIDPKGFPAAWGGRCLAVIPHNDRIVPPESALALAEQLPACTIFRPRLGHVSMMASPQARAVMWDHVVAWLRDDVPV